MINFLVKSISLRFGVEESAVNYLSAIVASYLASLIYALYIVRNRSIDIKILYFLAVGFFLVFSIYGINVFHSLISCFFCYFTLKCLTTRIALALNMIFTMTYLLYGYYTTQVDWTYTLTWTMPQCILTLRLIAFSFDVLDGQEKIKEKDETKISRHMSSSIKQCPSFLSFLSYCYFPGAFFCGPLIPYVSYEKFLKTNNFDISRLIRLSLIRLSCSLLILIIYIVGNIYWPLKYLMSPDFNESSLFWRLTSIAIVTKIYMYKYILCWLISESSLIACGITETGIGPFSNINLIAFETATSFTGIIKSYNISTNNFAFKYIYRRLKFLGNAYFSQIITLIFLSIWHGFESGYHAAFLMEFLLIYFEKTFFPLYNANKMKTNERPTIFIKHQDKFIWIIGRLYTFYFLGYSFVPFMLLDKDLWIPIYSSVYFIGHVLLITYLFVTISYNSFVIQKKSI